MCTRDRSNFRVSRPVFVFKISLERSQLTHRIYTYRLNYVQYNLNLYCDLKTQSKTLRFVVVVNDV